MLMYLDKEFDKDFIKNYVAPALKLKIESSLLDVSLTKMDAYLKATLNTDVASIVEQLEIATNKSPTAWVISISNNNFDKKSQEKIITLVKLIEYGNLEIKGLHVIEEAFKYIKEHVYALYKLYVMKGGE